MNLGKIVGVSKNRHVILRSIDWQSYKNLPKIGDKVFNLEKKKIGSIYDIFGPVQKPYISVKLFTSSSTTLDEYAQKNGSFLYTFRETQRSTRSPKSRSSKSRSRSPRPSSKKRGFHRVSPK